MPIKAARRWQMLHGNVNVRSKTNTLSFRAVLVIQPSSSHRLKAIVIIFHFDVSFFHHFFDVAVSALSYPGHHVTISDHSLSAAIAIATSPIGHHHSTVVTPASSRRRHHNVPVMSSQSFYLRHFCAALSSSLSIHPLSSCFCVHAIIVIQLPSSYYRYDVVTIQSSSDYRRHAVVLIPARSFPSSHCRCHNNVVTPASSRNSRHAVAGTPSSLYHHRTSKSPRHCRHTTDTIVVTQASSSHGHCAIVAVTSKPSCHYSQCAAVISL